MGLPPGFRFHPTDEELVVHYLRKKVYGLKLEDGIIGEVDLYKLEPWDLPEKCARHSGDPEWYFFHALDKKYPHSSRANRATVAGYWKATGKDRRVCTGNRMVGMKKTLVFYLGRAPRGERTDWIMHEYRLDEELKNHRKDCNAFVLCRVHQKGGPGPRNGEQYGAPVVDENDVVESCTRYSSAYENQMHPELSGKFFLQNQPLLIGCLDTSAQVSNNVGCVGVEALNSGEGFEGLLKCFFSGESLDTSLEPAYPLNFEQGLSEGGFGSANHSLVMPKDCCFEPLHIPVVPNLMDLEVDVHDDLHAILHPAPNEEGMLGDILEILSVGDSQTVSLMNNTVEQNERMSIQPLAYSLDLIGDDYIELADLEHPLDEFLFTLPMLETDGSVIYGEQQPQIYDNNEIEAWNRSSWTIGRSIQHEDTLQNESIYTGNGQSPSSEVPMLTSGEMEDIPNIELKNAVIMYSSLPAKSTFTYISSGSSSTSDPQSSETQSIKNDKKFNDNFLSDETLVDEVSERNEVAVQPFTAENLAGANVPAKDGYLVATREASSAPLSVNTCGTKDTGFVSSKAIKSGSEDQSSIVNFNLEDVLCLNLTGINVNSMGILFSDDNQYSHLDLADKNRESISQITGSSYFAAAFVVKAGQGICICCQSTLVIIIFVSNASYLGETELKHTQLGQRG